MTEFHADDYGLFPAQSRRILNCHNHGVLNGTSIIANGDELEACLALLPQTGLRLSVHLNLLQGHCLAPKEDVSLLVDEQGVFRISFFRLLVCSFSFKKDSYKQQIKAEYRAQIYRLLPLLHAMHQTVRLDGHAHWHLVPVAFDALMELIQEENLDVQYIRIPAEPIQLYLRHFFRILPFPPINIVKSLLLRLLARRDCRVWRKELAGMERKLFLGVLLSGCFDRHRLRVLLSDAEAMASQEGCGLEILAHPGGVYEPDDQARITNSSDLRFFTSPARQTEAESFLMPDLHSRQGGI